MQEWQKLNDVLDNMLRETVARGDTLAPGWRDEVRAVVRDMLAAERERWMAVVSWALGTNGDFREQGTMEGRYWWRGELAERAGLRWDGTRWVDAGPNVRANRS